MEKDTILSKMKGITLHPFIFAVYPILSLYARNMSKGYFDEAVSVTIAVLTFTLLLRLLLGLFVKNSKRLAVFLSLFFVLFFSYTHMVSAFNKILVRLQPLKNARFIAEGSSDPFWVVIWGCVVVVAAFFVVKLPGDLRLATKFLNIVAVTLLAMVGINLATNGVEFHVLPHLRADTKPGVDTNQSAAPLPSTTLNNSDQNSFDDETLGYLPDIYYIIVDAYARADVLEEIYQLDNSELLSYLAEKGFYVANKSKANYLKTTHSLASSLNFVYLDDLVNQVGTETDNRQPLGAMIKNNKLFQYLHNRGYTILAFSSGYKFTDITNADIYMSAPKLWDLNEFQETLIMPTPLSVFRRTWFDFRRNRVLYAFDHMVDATSTKEPTFTFVHVLVPHWPFIFGANGESIDPKKGKGTRRDYEYDEFIEGYRNQLTFINKRLPIVIDEILSRSPEPPIIILQADHGPDASVVNLEQNIETYLLERVPILNAYYFPDQNYASLYEDITPVNTFRIVLNNYFGTDYELLEDRNYYSSRSLPYLFTDVTDQVSTGQDMDYP